MLCFCRLVDFSILLGQTCFGIVRDIVERDNLKLIIGYFIYLKYISNLS